MMFDGETFMSVEWKRAPFAEKCFVRMRMDAADLLWISRNL